MTHKFVLELFKTVKAIDINEKNRNTLWQDGIEKEIENMNIAFQIVPDGGKPPNGYQYVNYHIVFDIKIDVIAF